MTNSVTSLHNKLKNIKMVAVDVDGVLTNGFYYYDRNGIALLQFHVHDGFGIRLLLNAGFKVAFITNSQNAIVKKRARDLGITALIEGVVDKRSAMQGLRRRFSINKNEILYIGDDILDLGAFKEASVCVAVANSAQALRNTADWITCREGGHGAVREVIDTLLAVRKIKTKNLLR